MVAVGDLDIIVDLPACRPVEIHVKVVFLPRLRPSAHGRALDGRR